ncbi:MAG TPA: branched-chain amino acid ABC transporter permease [Burkholderiaceae bacterium]
MLERLFGVLFDGVAYGSLLFLISVGLSVTMGLMNFINLAHGAFAMFGGYVAVWAMNRMGWPFLACLPLAFLCSAVAGVVLEQLLYRHLYRAKPLDQVLFSIGLTFMAMAGATWVWGSSQQPVALPSWLMGQVSLFGLADIEVGRYRLFLIAFVIVIAALLGYLVGRTRFGAQLRAAVDNREVAGGLGINVRLLFTLTFALGSGLAGLGGGLGIEVLGLDPVFPIKYMVYFLLVVVVGGAGTMRGPLYASLLLGVFDVAGKYYLRDYGSFVIYAPMIVLPLLFPAGLLRKRS